MEGGRDIPTSADVLLETPITHIHIKMFVRCVFLTSSGQRDLLELDTSRWRAEGGGERGSGTQGYSNISFDQRWCGFGFQSI